MLDYVRAYEICGLELVIEPARPVENADEGEEFAQESKTLSNTEAGGEAWLEHALLAMEPANKKAEVDVRANLSGSLFSPSTVVRPVSRRSI